jgi:hypothetical protein
MAVPGVEAAVQMPGCWRWLFQQWQTHVSVTGSKGLVVGVYGSGSGSRPVAM